MGEQRTVRAEDMATTSTAVAIVPPQTQEEPVERVAVITLKKQKQCKKVVWTEDTVDNEDMNKKKSKCCCIYEKPHKFGESDSEDSDDECEHCFGHVEKRKGKHTHTHTHDGTTPSSSTVTEEQTPTEPTATITLKPAEPAPAPPDKADKPDN